MSSSVKGSVPNGSDYAVAVPHPRVPIAKSRVEVVACSKSQKKTVWTNTGTGSETKSAPRKREQTPALHTLARQIWIYHRCPGADCDHRDPGGPSRGSAEYRGRRRETRASGKKWHEANEHLLASEPSKRRKAPGVLPACRRFFRRIVFGAKKAGANSRTPCAGAPNLVSARPRQPARVAVAQVPSEDQAADRRFSA